jgi:hypothetical protein
MNRHGDDLGQVPVGHPFQHPGAAGEQAAGQAPDEGAEDRYSQPHQHDHEESHSRDTDGQDRVLGDRSLARIVSEPLLRPFLEALVAVSDPIGHFAHAAISFTEGGGCGVSPMVSRTRARRHANVRNSPQSVTAFAFMSRPELPVGSARDDMATSVLKSYELHGCRPSTLYWGHQR